MTGSRDGPPVLFPNAPNRRGRRPAAAADLAALFGAVAGLMLSSLPALAQQPVPSKDIPGLLRDIRDEVKPMGAHPGEPFIQWNFFIGDGDDDTNKLVHALIMIEPSGDYEKLRLQVTWLERSPRDPKIRTARDNRLLSCLFKGPGFHLIASEFTDAELEVLLPGLLKAVREKKRLLER